MIFNRHSHFFLWLPVGTYYSLIFILSHSDPSAYVVYPFVQFDKILHFFEYLFFGFILARAFFWERQAYHRINHIRLGVIVALMVAALLDEFHQSFLSYRQSDVWDFVVDLAGGTTGAFIGRLYYLRRFRLFSKQPFFGKGTVPLI